MHTSTKSIILLLLAIFGSTIAQDDPYRLPPNYIVNHYDIDLTVPAESFHNFTTNDYQGIVFIEFQVTVRTSEIKLHASYNIDLIKILLDSVEISESDYEVNTTTSILTLNAGYELETETNYTLKIDFNAALLTGGGFYKAAYIDPDGVTEYIATTQFEATSARNAFPCFDEPRYKATFAYALTYPSNMNALTNTPNLTDTVNEETGLTRTVFGVTPVMPVYLVAFIISKYTCDEEPLEGSTSVTHRICSRADKENIRVWSKSLTPKVIESLNTYTGVNYSASLSKLDQVAVSGKSGAMENWGLVLYSENGLLFDNTVQTSSNKQGIAAVIAHELAHQWFGNLVTCKWWSEIFLNEGFATMFEYYTVEDVLPDFEMEKQFVIKILQPMLSNDQNINALRSNASTPAQISAKFNAYSYYKGGSVLRMVEHVLGRANFRSGIQAYLRTNAYQPAEPQDLWDALQTETENEISNFPVGTNLSDVVENWIEQPGYPVLNVSSDGTTIRISQQLFLFEGTASEPTTWYVPVSYTTSGNNDNNEDTAPKGWLTPTSDLEIPSIGTNDWIVVNNQQTGYYKVNYDTALWNNLATALKQANFSGIHVLNRAQIASDSYTLARAGQLSYAQALRNVEFLENDTSYFSWYPGVDIFSYLLTRIDLSTRLGQAINSHFIQLLGTAVDLLPLTTVDEKNQIYTLNQEMLNRYACKFGRTASISNAISVFQIYRNSYVRPNINIRAIVYCNAIRYSENLSNDWDFLWEQFQNASVSADRNSIWSGLGCATDPTHLRSFLSKILDGDAAVTPSLYSSIFSTIYNANEVGVDTALDYLIENFQDLLAKYTADGVTINSVLTGLGSAFTRTSQVEKLQAFIASGVLTGNLLTSANSALSTALSRLAIIDGLRSDLNIYYALDDEDNTTASSTTTSTSTTSTTTTTTTSTTTTTAAPSTSTEAPPDDGGGASTLRKSNVLGLILISLVNILFVKF